jgi:hypothetical protein
MKIPAVAVLLGLALPAFAAATGRVVGPDGAPVPGAEACEFVDGMPPHCVPVDREGSYRMDKPTRHTVLIRASGFIPATVEAAPLNVPVTLHPAATLKVKVVDAVSGAAVASGRVMINAPSGQRIGEYVPFNKAGVRISTLPPGPVFVRAEAKGYQPGGPLAVDLVGGAERAVTVPMTKSDGSSH